MKSFLEYSSPTGSKYKEETVSDEFIQERLLAGLILYDRIKDRVGGISSIAPEDVKKALGDARTIKREVFKLMFTRE